MAHYTINVHMTQIFPYEHND